MVYRWWGFEGHLRSPEKPMGAAWNLFRPTRLTFKALILCPVSGSLGTTLHGLNPRSSTALSNNIPSAGGDWSGRGVLCAPNHPVLLVYNCLDATLIGHRRVFLTRLLDWLSGKQFQTGANFNFQRLYPELYSVIEKMGTFPAEVIIW